MIIGLTGKNAAGKGESAKHLQKMGFHYFSLSDELRLEATRMGIGHSRDELVKLGTELREKFGTNYLASKINEKIGALKQKDVQKFVVDSVRNSGEVAELRKNDDFDLFAIEADAKLRFTRMIKRGRAGDAATFEKFMEQESKENSNSGAGQQMELCIEMAAHTVVNNGTLEELHSKLDAILKEESWLE
jgi:dephospho-CoA kinase